MQEREGATTTNNKQQTIICIEPFCPSPPALRTPALRTTLMGCCPHRSASREDGELSADQGSSDSTESRRSPEEGPGLAVPHPHQRGFPGFSSRWSSRGAGRPGRHAGTRPHGPSPHFLLSTSAGVGCRATETRPSSTLRTPLCPTRTTEERLTQPGPPNEAILTARVALTARATCAARCARGLPTPRPSSGTSSIAVDGGPPQPPTGLS